MVLQYQNQDGSFYHFSKHARNCVTRIAFNSYDNEILSFAQDEVAEWLRRWTANPLGSARVGSNPILVDDFESLKPTHPKSNPR